MKISECEVAGAEKAIGRHQQQNPDGLLAIRREPRHGRLPARDIVSTAGGVDIATLPSGMASKVLAGHGYKRTTLGWQYEAPSPEQVREIAEKAFAKFDSGGL